MSTKFYIKAGDTAEDLRVLIKRRQEPVNGVTPPDSFWVNSKSIEKVFFSMAKIPQTQDDGTILYPDGSILNLDGTIINPLGNPNVYIAGVTLRPGEILNEDYSILQTDGNTRYPNGIIITSATYDPASSVLLPNNSILLPNGMIKLPPTPAFPQGYNYNPGDIDRTNYYKVANPTVNPPLPNGEIPLPPNSYLDSANTLQVGPKVLQLPPGSLIISTTTVNFPAGTVKEESTTINRDNALILPKDTQFYPNIYAVSYTPTTRVYTFPNGCILSYDHDARTARVIFPNAAQMPVPYETIEVAPDNYVFPYGTEHIFGLKKFIFPGKVITLPLSATINVFGSNVSVTFATNTILNAIDLTATLTVGDTLLTSGDVSLYDGSLIKLNTNHIVLYNGFEFYPRGTQKNSLGTIIHPPGSQPEGSYLRYYPTKEHPAGLLIRSSDAAIVNNDGTFTKLDNSVVDANGNVIQQANTNVALYEATENPPYIPVDTRTSIVTINQSTGSFSTINYAITSQSTQQATLLRYHWLPDDTKHPGLYSGEFTLVYNDGTKRTFPVLKDDTLFIEVLDHFSQA